MASYLRKCIVLGPQGITQPGSYNDYHQPSSPATNRSLINTFGNTWVRFWAPWPQLQPQGDYPPGVNPNNPPALLNSMDALDKQVALARHDGHNVIITAYQFPRWVNGLEDPKYDRPLPPAKLKPDEVEFMKQDRMTKADYDAWKADDNLRPAHKDLQFLFPTDTSPTGHWGKWIRFLMERYQNDGETLVVLEIMNEPSNQWFPIMNGVQGDIWAPGEVRVQCFVSWMMDTAQAICAGLGYPCYLAAPAMWDKALSEMKPGRERLEVAYGPLTDWLIGMLDNNNFVANPKFMWTHHNYKDVDLDCGPGSMTGTGNNRAQVVRSKLVGHWAGWPQPAGNNRSNPYVNLTEGGGRLKVIEDLWTSGEYNNGNPQPRPTRQQVLDRQALLVERNWNRMRQNTGEGAGIGMVSNYLLYDEKTDPDSDTRGDNSGLRNRIEPDGSGGATRPVFAKFRDFQAGW